MHPPVGINPASFPVWATLALGFVLGVRHALDADHLAAVSTFVSQERNILRSSLVGAYWGMGHTAALLFFGVAIAVFRIAVSPRLSQLLEFLVGCMLVFLGASVLVKLVKDPPVHAHRHEHDGVAHTHWHFHAAREDHGHDHHLFRVAGRPFMVGVVHGLAGTAAVMLLLVSAIPSLLLTVGCILIFGFGTIVGMVAMSLLMSVPVALAAGRLAVAERGIRLVSGLFSLGFGIFLAWGVGFVQFYLR